MNQIRLMTRPWLRTATGRDVFLDRIEGITIEDIAASLAKLNRFNGHTRVPFSVAQHSVHVCRMIKLAGHDPILQLAGLMHDAPEAYLGDLTSPVQLHIFGDRKAGAGPMSPWVQAHRDIELTIWRELALPPVWPAGAAAIVRHFDLVALRTEWRDLMAGSEPADFAKLPAPHPEPIRPFENWQTAQEVFLAYFTSLTKVIAGEVLK